MVQSEMDRCADLDARQADVDLTRAYEELLFKMKNEDNATRKLQAAESAWLAFRDAHTQELNPAKEKQADYGSMYPMCYAQVATEMTKERTAQLRKMLDDKDPCDTSASSDHSDDVVATEHLIQEALKPLAEVRPGDSLASLERSFEQDGGLQFAGHLRYVFKKCHYVKVDIDFSGEGIANREALPSDRVIRVPRPYLEYPAYD